MDEIFIENYIPAGYEHRVSRHRLVQLTQIGDRKNRQEIEEAIDRGIFIASWDGGYFQYRDERDIPYIRSYVRQEDSRFYNLAHKHKMLHRALDIIIPSGQMSFDWGVINGR